MITAEQYIYAAWRLRDEFGDREVLEYLHQFSGIGPLWTHAVVATSTEKPQNELDARIWAEAMASRLEGTDG